MVNLMSSWLVASGLSADEVSEIVKEKLKDILMEKFSPSQADSIFAEMQSAPHWLDVMIEHPEWRALIYRVRDTLSLSLLHFQRTNECFIVMCWWWACASHSCQKCIRAV
jgi:hypothetical protein